MVQQGVDHIGSDDFQSLMASLNGFNDYKQAKAIAIHNDEAADHIIFTGKVDFSLLHW